MAIKNYRTTVDANKTVGEIQTILVNAGCSDLAIIYNGGDPSALQFRLPVGGQHFTYRLPANPSGVLATMERDGVGGSLCTIAHARRVSWRIIKDWLHAQMAIIDAGQAKPAEVFLPYLLERDGRTLYQKFEQQQLQLTEGGEDVKN